MKNIEWADMAWNPVWGCLRGCNYCYARKIASRFANVIAKREIGMFEGAEGVEYDLLHFRPVWLESSFKKWFRKKPSRIFVNSMSDISFWEVDWMRRVLERIIENPKHIFFFLTKDPDTYTYYQFPSNCWLGVSCPGRPTMEMVQWAITCKNPHFVSIEPLIEDPYTDWLEFVDWVIIGGLTPHPKHKRHWVDRIISMSAVEKKPVFIKNNVQYPGCKYQEFPEELR